MRKRSAKRTVELLGFPVAAYLESRAHVDALARELLLVALGGAPTRDPATTARVCELVDAYARSHESDLWRATHRRIEEAAARGEDAVDLRFVLPVEVAGGVEQFRALLEEAEEYCRSGDLLTVEASPQVRRLRAWYFEQVVGQLRHGAAPQRFLP